MAESSQLSSDITCMLDLNNCTVYRNTEKNCETGDMKNAKFHGQSRKTTMCFDQRIKLSQ